MSDNLFHTTCEACGVEYDARHERLGDHAEDCPIRQDYERLWQEVRRHA